MPAQVLRQRYRVAERVGHGAVGVVYRALDLATEQPCALKQLLATTPADRLQFEREADLLARLRHPSLPSASDYFVEGGQPLLVMTLIAGPDLGQLLTARGQPFVVPTVLRWMDGLIEHR